MHHRSRTSDMGCIAVSEQETVQPVHAARPEVAAQNALKIPCGARVEKPIPPCASHMHRGTFVEIKRCDFGVSAIGPMRPREIQMAGRGAGEQLHGAEDQPGETPVRVVENNGERGSDRGEEERYETIGKDEKRERHDDQIGQQ